MQLIVVKKTFTVKNTVICDVCKFIWFLGQSTQGSVHDFNLLQLDFDPKEDWFKCFRVLVDKGYIGIDKTYQIEQLHIPAKCSRTPKGQPKAELTKEQKKHNKLINQVRMIIEHAIGGIKRFQILLQRFRNKLPYFDDLVIQIAAGLWNLHLKIHHN